MLSAVSRMSLSAARPAAMPARPPHVVPASISPLSVPLAAARPRFPLSRSLIVRSTAANALPKCAVRANVDNPTKRVALGAALFSRRGLKIGNYPVVRDFLPTKQGGLKQKHFVKYRSNQCCRLTVLSEPKSGIDKFEVTTCSGTVGVI